MEVMISITVLTMVTVSVLPIVGWLISRGRNFANENRAGFLLQEGMEVGYNVFLDKWDDEFVVYPEGIYHPAVSVADGQDSWVLLPGAQDGLETRFSRKIEVGKVCRDQTSGEWSEFPCSGTNVFDEKSRIIKTSVYWNESGKPTSVNAKLLLTKLQQ